MHTIAKARAHGTATGRRFGWRTSLALAGTLASLVSATRLGAEPVAASDAPIAWLRYAGTATEEVASWLQADDAAAIRLRGYLDTLRTSQDTATAPIVLKIWVKSDSRIARMEFDPLADAGANADLRMLVLGKRFSGSPPKGMRLPMRIAVQLDPRPPEADVGAIAGPVGP